MKKSSKVWIIGAVVGPFAALAIIGLGFWTYLERDRRKRVGANPPQVVMIPSGQPAVQGPYLGSATAPPPTTQTYWAGQSPPPQQYFPATAQPFSNPGQDPMVGSAVLSEMPTEYALGPKPS